MGKLPYWRLSGYYLLYFSTLGGLLPYWGLYLQAKGFTAEQIGELIAILVGTKLVAANMWGWIADHTGKGIFIIRIAAFFAALAFAGFFVPGGYLWFALITLIFSFFWNATLPQFEALTLAHLGDDTHRYSRIRIWGSIGFIIAALGIGRALDVYGNSLLPMLIVLLLAGSWLVSQCVPESSYRPSRNGNEGLVEILKSPAVVAFLIVCMLVQASHGPYYVFYSIYLEDNDYNGTQIGQLWSLGVIAEVILFLFVYRILKRFTLRGILLTSIFLGMVRWTIIAWDVNNAGLLILAQLLHAASFGSTHVAAIHLIHKYFYGRFQGRGQALYSSASFGLGGVLGSLYSGHLWDKYGPVFVFTVASCISALALMITWRWVEQDGFPKPEVVSP